MKLSSGLTFIAILFLYTCAHAWGKPKEFLGMREGQTVLLEWKYHKSDNNTYEPVIVKKIQNTDNWNATAIFCNVAKNCRTYSVSKDSVEVVDERKDPFGLNAYELPVKPTRVLLPFSSPWTKYDIVQSKPGDKVFVINDRKQNTASDQSLSTEEYLIHFFLMPLSENPTLIYEDDIQVCLSTEVRPSQLTRLEDIQCNVKKVDEIFVSDNPDSPFTKNTEYIISSEDLPPAVSLKTGKSVTSLEYKGRNLANNLDLWQSKNRAGKVFYFHLHSATASKIYQPLAGPDEKFNIHQFDILTDLTTGRKCRVEGRRNAAGLFLVTDLASNKTLVRAGSQLSYDWNNADLQRANEGLARGFDSALEAFLLQSSKVTSPLKAKVLAESARIIRKYQDSLVAQEIKLLSALSLSAVITGNTSEIYTKSIIPSFKSYSEKNDRFIKYKMNEKVFWHRDVISLSLDLLAANFKILKGIVTQDFEKQTLEEMVQSLGRASAGMSRHSLDNVLSSFEKNSETFAEWEASPSTRDIMIANRTLIEYLRGGGL